MAEIKEFVSKGRLDALTDGVFAFAMTLLVVKFDLPEDFHAKSAAELSWSTCPRRHVHRLNCHLPGARIVLAWARAYQGGTGRGKWRLRLGGTLPLVLRHPPAVLMIVVGRTTSCRQYASMPPTWSFWP